MPTNKGRRGSKVSVYRPRRARFVSLFPTRDSPGGYWRLWIAAALTITITTLCGMVGLQSRNDRIAAVAEDATPHLTVAWLSRPWAIADSIKTRSNGRAIVSEGLHCELRLPICRAASLEFRNPSPSGLLGRNRRSTEIRNDSEIQPGTSQVPVTSLAFFATIL